MIDYILSFLVSNKKALAILFMIICLAVIYPGMFTFLYIEGRDFGRSLVNSILS
jgi:phosphotransferase system  glucose/maltose/N-acetylglucosamine-specific IIC component